MSISGRALLLFWAVYALDFATSALFVTWGYGFAETNQAQIAFLSAPGLGSLVPWLLNQSLWIALGALGILGFLVPKASGQRLHLNFLLVFLTLVRLYGVAANVAFTLQATTGTSLAAPGLYALLCVPVIAACRHELRGSLRPLLRYQDRPG